MSIPPPGHLSATGTGITGSGTTTLTNTLVAARSVFTFGSGTDLSGSFVSNGNNLIGDIGSATGLTHGVNGDIVGGQSGTIGGVPGVFTSISMVTSTAGQPLHITTASAHGLMTGDRVRIEGVIGVFTPSRPPA